MLNQQRMNAIRAVLRKAGISIKDLREFIEIHRVLSQSMIGAETVRLFLEQVGDEFEKGMGGMNAILED